MCIAQVVCLFLLFARLLVACSVLLSAAAGTTVALGAVALGALVLSAIGLGAVIRATIILRAVAWSAVVLRAIVALRPGGRLSFVGGSHVGVPIDLGSLIGGWRRFGLSRSVGGRRGVRRRRGDGRGACAVEEAHGGAGIHHRADPGVRRDDGTRRFVILHLDGGGVQPGFRQRRLRRLHAQAIDLGDLDLLGAQADGYVDRSPPLYVLPS